MKILYRVSSKLQDNKSPIYGDDKYTLVASCFKSFLMAYRGDEELIFLLDNCGWDDLFEGYGKIIHYHAGDKDKSVRYMFSYAKNDPDDYLFLEDDYLWQPHSMHRLWSALPELGLISPYDHPSHFIEERFGPFDIKLVNGFTYRNCDSNTHTFMCSKELLEKHVDTMISFGSNDDQMFRSLGDTLWCPSYSCATHLVDGLLAPNVDWYGIINP